MELAEQALNCQNQVIQRSDSCVPQYITEGGTEYYGLAVSPWLWLINFSLIYFVDPNLAAYMQAHRNPIPEELASALLECTEVRFDEYKALLITT